MKSFGTLRKYLRAFHLPMPSKKQAFVTLRTEVALPLTDYGCLFRFRLLNTDPAPKTPLALTPICESKIRKTPFFLPEGSAQVSLYPGIPQVGISKTDHGALSFAFLKAGYHTFGDPEDDCGYLPAPRDKSWTPPLPVLIDVTDAEKLTDSTRKIEKILRRTLKAGVRPIDDLDNKLGQAQSALYGDLQEKCAEMLTAKGKKNPERLAADFWSAMRAATRPEFNNGTPRLAAPWKDSDPCIVGITSKAYKKSALLNRGALSYIETLRRDPFHARILTA